MGTMAEEIASFAFNVAIENEFSNSQCMQIKNGVESLVETFERRQAKAMDAEKLGNAIKDYVEKYHELAISIGEYDGYREIVINDYDNLTLNARAGIICFETNDDEEDEDWEEEDW